MTGPAMSEQRLDYHVRKIVADIQKLRPGSLIGYHTHDSRRSASGFPDWVFAGPGGVIFRELKTAKGKPSPAQHHWINMLRGAGADVAVWRPADLEQARIVWQLSRIARMIPPAPLLPLPPDAQALVDRILEDE